MTRKLADAQRALEKTKATAQRRLDEIEVERAEIKASIKSIDAAIKALTGRKPRLSRRSAHVLNERPAGDSDKAVSE